MPLYFNISIALVLFMGLASGGLLALTLMADRKQQTSFSIMLALALLLALAGAISSTGLMRNLASGLTNALVLLVLSFSLGYTLTAHSVLTPARRRPQISPPEETGQGHRTAVILLTRGEPEHYSVESAARRLELADDRGDVPPIPLRPFYMRDLKGKYAATGPSPYRNHQLRLAEKVQARLDSNHRVTAAFYSDTPELAYEVAQAIGSGAKHVVIVHVLVADPPDPVMSGEVMEGLSPESYGVRITEVGPFWLSSLLPQIYVRRMLEAVPQDDSQSDTIGILLVGRGHGTSSASAAARQEQEVSFQGRVIEALVRTGWSEKKIATGWLRARPGVDEAFAHLVATGCKSVYWLPTTFPADGINTLYDIPAQIEVPAREAGIRIQSLQAWNADDLAAEEIANHVTRSA
ncbi:MAG: ferrochelatase [Chloroflexota bacterium]|nr:ferrochelatase [Chloroflexota bacterium]